MFDAEKTKKSVIQFNNELAEAIEEYQKSYKALMKVIGWLPGSVQYAIKKQIEETVAIEMEVEEKFERIMPTYITYTPWEEEQSS